MHTTHFVTNDPIGEDVLNTGLQTAYHDVGEGEVLRVDVAIGPRCAEHGGGGEREELASVTDGFHELSFVRGQGIRDRTPNDVFTPEFRRGRSGSVKEDLSHEGDQCLLRKRGRY